MWAASSAVMRAMGMRVCGTGSRPNLSLHRGRVRAKVRAALTPGLGRHFRPLLRCPLDQFMREVTGAILVCKAIRRGEGTCGGLAFLRRVLLDGCFVHPRWGSTVVVEPEREVTRRLVPYSYVEQLCAGMHQTFMSRLVASKRIVLKAPICCLDPRHLGVILKAGTTG